MKLKSIVKFLIGGALITGVIVVVAVISFIVYFCNSLDNEISDSNEVRDEVNDSIILQTEPDPESEQIEKEPNVHEKIDPKFLITDKSAGFFKLNDTITNLAKLYGWTTKQSSFNYDGCDNPLIIYSGGILVFNKYSARIENACPAHKDKDTTKYFYNETENCDGYFCKDTIGWIWITGKDFKTIEGIGVGSTFRDIQKAFPEVYANYSSGADGDWNIYVELKKYPKVEFHFAYEALTIDLEDERNESNGLKLEDGSHFHRDSTVYIIKMYHPNEF